FLRLFSVQPLISMQRRSGSMGRRVSGVGMENSPVRYLSVVESEGEPRMCEGLEEPAAAPSRGLPRDPCSAAACRADLRGLFDGGGPRRSCTVPATTTFPPWAPAPGPMSI